MWLLARILRRALARAQARRRDALDRQRVERSHGYWLLSLSRLTSSSRPNMSAMPDGAKPAVGHHLLAEGVGLGFHLARERQLAGGHAAWLPG